MCQGSLPARPITRSSDIAAIMEMIILTPIDKGNRQVTMGYRFGCSLS
jgi:hypothetical protein